jgi:hypothetical protein
MKISEADIQSLKAQEAKDLAIKLLGDLQAKDKGFISPGEVQLKELEYELMLREAEFEDQRQHEEHEERIRQLELQLEQQRTAQAQAKSHAQSIREAHARLVEQVESTTESLSMRLMRSTREYNLKLEKLEADYNARAEDLKRELSEMEAQRLHLQGDIYELAELQETAEEVGQLRQTLESRRHASQQELEQLEEQAAALQFERTKRINETKRSQELAILELQSQHNKSVVQLNRQTADKILEQLGLEAISREQRERLEQQSQQQSHLGEEQQESIRRQAREEVRKEYNITMPEVIDVTRLYYREQSLAEEVASLRGQVEKLETEIRRMREHIEQEPQRIAKAVEAAKSTVQNYIEQGGKSR